MDIRLDALIAEIVTSIDLNTINQFAEFESLPRANRVHLILATLARRRIAASKSIDRGQGTWWTPSPQLRNYYGVTNHGLPDKRDVAEAPVVESKLANELSDLFQSNADELNTAAGYVVRQFALYKLGLLEIQGKKNGLHQFYRSSATMYVIDENGIVSDFVDKFL